MRYVFKGKASSAIIHLEEVRKCLNVWNFEVENLPCSFNFILYIDSKQKGRNRKESQNEETV